MEHFAWQVIKFSDGSNPYICTTEKKFKYMKKKYNLTKIKDNYWLANIYTLDGGFYDEH